MKKGPLKAVPDPHRGLRTRADFDRLCHVEVQEEVNTFLMQFATHDPDDHRSLKLVAVNPDGERKNPQSINEYLCFWHPEIEALRLKQKLYVKPSMSAEGEDKEAAAFHRFYTMVRDFRSMARGQVRLQEARHELLEEEEEEDEEEWEDEALRQQREWERRKLAGEC
jgi:hypothetical protein